MKFPASSPGATGAKSATRLRILVVDDHPVTREGISLLLEGAADMTVCGETDSAEQALEMIQQLKPKVVIADIQLKGVNGIELVKNARALQPDLLFLVMSMHDESVYAERALRAGAMGYLMKREATDKILEAIRAIAAGEVYLSDEAKGKMLHRLVNVKKNAPINPTDTLSDREIEIFQLIGDGFGSREIAERLKLSRKTVDSYREHLKTKLQIATGAELVRHAIQWQRSEGHG